MPKNLEFRESLEEMALAEMFANIDRHKVPGLFELSWGDHCKRIYISDGNIIHAASTDQQDWLGNYLHRMGRLSKEDLAATIDIRETSDKRHGQILIEQGLLSPAELYAAVRSQMEAIVWSVFSWQQGQVTFRIGEFNDPLMIKIHLPMRQVIVRGIQRVPDVKALLARLGEKESLFRPTYCTEDLVEVALERDDYELLRLVDGKKTLLELCNEGPHSVSGNARALYAFRVLRLIEKRERAESTGVLIRLDSHGNVSPQKPTQ